MAIDLSDGVESLEVELTDIENVLHSHSGTRTVHCMLMRYTPLEDGCVVSLWDAWTRFVRNLLLTSAHGQSVGMSGSTYSPSTARGEAAAIQELRAHSALRGSTIHVVAGEPKWSDLRAIGDMARALQLANYLVIESAVTASSVALGAGVVMASPPEEIRVIRNYIAHKSDRNAERVRQYIGQTHDITSYLREKQSGGLPRYCDWIDGLKAIANAAAN